jgi:hypothetical protein
MSGRSSDQAPRHSSTACNRMQKWFLHSASLLRVSHESRPLRLIKIDPCSSQATKIYLFKLCISTLLEEISFRGPFSSKTILTPSLSPCPLPERRGTEPEKVMLFDPPRIEACLTVSRTFHFHLLFCYTFCLSLSLSLSLSPSSWFTSYRFHVYHSRVSLLTTDEV